jgi:hypothetical protein
LVGGRGTHTPALRHVLRGLGIAHCFPASSVRYADLRVPERPRRLVEREPAPLAIAPQEVGEHRHGPRRYAFGATTALHATAYDCNVDFKFKRKPRTKDEEAALSRFRVDWLQYLTNPDLTPTPNPRDYGLRERDARKVRRELGVPSAAIFGPRRR